MVKISLPSHLEDKIFEIKYDSGDKVSEIVSYFPLSESEIQETLSFLHTKSFTGFRSIFADKITSEEWENTKKQIKKKFKDELFGIDDVS